MTTAIIAYCQVDLKVNARHPMWFNLLHSAKVLLCLARRKVPRATPRLRPSVADSAAVAAADTPSPPVSWTTRRHTGKLKKSFVTSFRPHFVTFSVSPPYPRLVSSLNRSNTCYYPLGDDIQRQKYQLFCPLVVLVPTKWSLWRHSTSLSLFPILPPIETSPLTVIIW